MHTLRQADTILTCKHIEICEKLNMRGGGGGELI